MLEPLVGDFVVLVVDKQHQRHGQIGKMRYHDWREFGEIGVEFVDGSKEEFYDGIMKGDEPSKIKWFYRHANKTGREFDEKQQGPVAFQWEYVLQGGSLISLDREYHSLFGEDLPGIDL